MVGLNLRSFWSFWPRPGFGWDLMVILIKFGQNDQNWLKMAILGKLVKFSQNWSFWLFCSERVALRGNLAKMVKIDHF